MQLDVQSSPAVCKTRRVKSYFRADGGFFVFVFMCGRFFVLFFGKVSKCSEFAEKRGKFCDVLRSVDSQLLYSM